MLATMSLGCTLYGVYFLMQDMLFPAMVILITVVRLWIATQVKSIKLAHFFAMVYLVLFWNFFQSPVELLPLTSVLITTYATFLLSGIKMRMTFLLPSTLWLTHNIIVGVPSGILLEVCILVVNLSTIYRMIRGERRLAAEAQAI